MTEFLDLQYNNIVGPIPSSLYNKKLQGLKLGGNAIAGNIASNISMMTELRVLNLGNSTMSGELPTELYHLPRLKELHLSNANFGGELSDDFRLLNETLMALSLDGNNFSGEIPGAFDDLEILGTCNNSPFFHSASLF